ncbi:PLP-dependent aminotransferase family protein [Roseovarius nitratireducens]|uniref:MocR-like pyridoxine biosynthesis transcription factor PdxR n=1 Tax=Roseovarius nitratireducens TaxID=2044597 RepID=UPI000CE24029|nr:PLP-dependent aminotransferase family protein [Roseovarius nitratireducens]
MGIGYRFSLPDNSPLPLRDQICEVVSEAVASHSIATGEALPSCRELSAELKVSRNTVFEAYARLIDLAILISKDRSGYYVNPDYVAQLPADTASPECEPAVIAEARLPEAGARPSDLRKVAHPPDWSSHPYPFIYNQIDPRIFPIQRWRECTRLALNVGRLPVWSGDSDGSDSDHLIEQLQKRLLSYRGLRAGKNEILITSGSQNALFILGLLFADQAGAVAMEDPGYPEARNAFALSGNEVIGVPVDADGLDIVAIPERCKVVYVTASHHFPSAVTMPLERRRKLLEMAHARQMIIIEDDYEAEMNFERDLLPPLRVLDREGSVAYCGSLSKILSPGLRLGFMVAHPEIIREAKAVRRAMLRHPPTVLQDTMANFMALGYLDAHLRKLRRRYRMRWTTMRQAVARHLPDFALGQSHGGTSLWIDGPPELDTDLLEENLKERGVLFDNGAVFFIDPRQGRGKFRLGFASIPLRSIEPGVEIIGEEIARLI